MQNRGEDEEYEETPQMFFEDVLDALRATRRNISRGPELQLKLLKSAAITTIESIEILRGIHHLDKLKKLEEVQEALWSRAQELETSLSKPRTLG